MDCSALEEIFIDEWSQGLQEKLRGKRYPLGGMFELTDRCNLSCVHCYINQNISCKDAKAAELSTIEVKNILNQLANAGVLFITFSGGEVLIRPDFLEIYHFAKSIGLVVTVFTNGTLITPRIADEFAQSRPRMIEITLYGFTRETYEKVTCVPGSYDRCMRGIDLILDRGLSLNIKTVVLTINAHELSSMRTFAEEKGVAFRYDGLLWPRLDGGNKSREFQISNKDLITLDNLDYKRKSEWKRIRIDYGGRFSRRDYIYSCGAGVKSFHINSSGSISACTMVREPNYNLKTIDFNFAWEDLGSIRSLKRTKNTICEQCDMGGLCNQCPGWSQLVHGDDESVVESICELAHLRVANLKE